MNGLGVYINKVFIVGISVVVFRRREIFNYGGWSLGIGGGWFVFVVIIVVRWLRG